MNRLSFPALLACSCSIWSASGSFAADVAKVAGKSTAHRSVVPASETTIAVPQRLTGFYHPNGVGVRAISDLGVDPAVPTPLVAPGAPAGPIAPVPPGAPPMTGGFYGQAGCGCGVPYPMYGAPGLAVGGYGPYGFDAPVDPYTMHFGPGFHRYNIPDGHVRFPYYSYRRPWYTPGSPSFNRDLNLPW